MTLGVPAWLETFLSLTTFFSKCQVHDKETGNECNSFCITCNIEAQCPHCITEDHEGHRVIQVRRSSGREIVRVTEIYKDLDIGGVESSMINNRRVVYLKKKEEDETKPKPKSNKRKKQSNNNGVGRWREHFPGCGMCDRGLSKPFYFCSLGCKLDYIEENDDERFVLTPRSERQMRRELLDEMSEIPSEAQTSIDVASDKKSYRRTNYRSSQSSLQVPPVPVTAPRNTSRRKGVPRWAPLT